MPHDRNGDPLKDGDRVTLRATVRHVWTNETACNVEIQVDAPQGEYSPILSLNARSLEKELGVVAQDAGD